MTFSAPHLQRFASSEDATATMEFVIVFPIIMMLFIAAFETSMILTRQVLLERSLDSAVRVLRLAKGVETSADGVRQAICDNTSVLQDCDELLTVDLQVIDRADYGLPADDQICANRGEDIVIRPDNEFQPGVDNELLLVRVCMIVDRILPFSGFGLNLARDASGGIHMTAATVFVNEPD